MKPSIVLAANRAAIRRVVESHRARNARVFGSVIHGDDTEDSDLDILIDPTPETTLFDIGAIRHELLLTLNCHCRLLTRCVMLWLMATSRWILRLSGKRSTVLYRGLTSKF